MAAAGDLEKGAVMNPSPGETKVAIMDPSPGETKVAIMDPSPGETKDKALRNKEEERVISHVFKLLATFGLYEFCAEQANPENEWQETKKTWMAAFAIIACDTAVITGIPKTNGGLEQAVLILATLSFLLIFILVLTPIAKPTLPMPNLKRCVLVSAGIVTAFSFLIYVANKMGRIVPSSIAAIIVSGLFVLFITILFLIQLNLGALPLTIAPGPSSVASAPRTGKPIA